MTQITPIALEIEPHLRAIRGAADLLASADGCGRAALEVIATAIDRAAEAIEAAAGRGAPAT